MAINAQLNRDNTSSVVQTTDGTTSTTIYSEQASLSSGGQIITFDICGFDFTNAEVATAKIVVKIKEYAGSITMVGSPVHLVPINVGSSAGLTTASVNVVISGGQIKINAIGVAGRTIDWTANRVSYLAVNTGLTATPAPEDGYVNHWVASNLRWEPVPPTVAIASTASGDLSGNYPSPTVAKINSTTITTAGGSLTDGYVLRATGTSSADWGKLDLANSGSVTGLLPQTNQEKQTMTGDVTGVTNGAVVVAINGSLVPTIGSVGNVLRVSAGPALSYGPLTLDGGAQSVTGQLPTANQVAQSMAGDVEGSTSASFARKITGSATTGDNRQIIVGGQPSGLAITSISPEDQTVASGSVVNGGGSSLYLLASRGKSTGADAAARVGGDITLAAGEGYNDGNGGDLIIHSGDSASGTGGDITLEIGVGGAGNGNLVIANPNTATSATAGANGDVPAQVAGYLIIKLDTVNYKIPYYAS